ncbi:hypothetical protein GALL_472880 [mine drainage metagenome]|uniref:Uncharacterized protein n=1 Tax=mine drainage metagenome TaxID=410659 RepID=A0A1J5PIT0_9ZZZZ
MQHHGFVFLVAIAHEIDHGIQVDRFYFRGDVARVFEEVADDAIGLLDVGNDVLPRLLVGYAQFRLQTQAREWRANVVGDAGEHQGALFFDFLQAARHAVEATIDFADFAHSRLFIKHLRVVSRTDSGGRQAQVAQRFVDEAGDDRSANECQQGGNHPPRHPGFAQGGIDARAVEQQPVVVAGNAKADPQSRPVVDDVGESKLFVETRVHCALQPVGEVGVVHRHPDIAGIARIDVDAFLFRQIVQQRDAVLRIGVDQRQPGEVDQAGDLLGNLLDLGPQFE